MPSVLATARPQARAATQPLPPRHEKPEPAVRRTPRSLLLTVAAIAAAASTALAGCSSGPSTEAVAWTDGVCGAMLKFTTVATTPPNIDQSNLGKTVQGLTAWLGDTSNAVQSSIDSLHSLGRSPVEGGDEVVTKLDSTLGSIKNSFDSARSTLAAVDPNDPVAAGTALNGAVTALQGLGNLDTSSLNSNAALNAAAAQAPNCKTLNSSTGG